jgi:hypothetical protein
MKTYWQMPNGLRPSYTSELDAYKSSFMKGELQVSWRHLERAHIIGQPWAGRTHSGSLFDVEVRHANQGLA